MKRALLLAVLASLTPTLGALATPPSDVLRSQQYALDLVEAPAAWEHADGSGVRVAVVDTGVDLAHADLVTRTAVGEGESVAEPTGLYANLPVGPWNTTQDTDGHGTLVAGLVAAERGNGVGIAGPSRATIVPIKVDDIGVLSTSELLAEGIRAGVAADADVVQVSQVTLADSGGLGDALEAAEREGVTVVAAAGNRGQASPDWPAAAGTTVAVGAVDEDAALWADSNRGVDVVAPGVEVLSTALGNRYAEATGTSLAAPIVSATAAMMLDACPSLEPTEVRSLVNATADDLAEPGWDPGTGWGLLQADDATQAALRACA